MPAAFEETRVIHLWTVSIKMTCSLFLQKHDDDVFYLFLQKQKLEIEPYSNMLYGSIFTQG